MTKKKRSSKVVRNTTETKVIVNLAIDGTGKTKIDTKIGFLDHMLTLFAFHGLFDLDLKAIGDLNVDIHHTNEDVAICLGKAFKEALGTCKGIKRYGSKEVPMDSSAAKATVDIGGRYAFVWKTPPTGWNEQISREEGYSFEEGKDFLNTFAKSGFASGSFA